MAKIRRSERILQAIRKGTADLDLGLPSCSLDDLAIRNLARLTGITENNISMELNRLHQAGELLRIGGRPVHYLAKRELETQSGRQFAVNGFASVEAFRLFLRGEEEGGPSAWASPAPSQLHPLSLIDTLIGIKYSLAKMIQQAKAAMSYPPHGLHTLITGPTGVGKSLFAQCMYDYSLKRGLLGDAAKLITLNCANYAENPQLLLSQLFGYVKGAFTGADSDKKGMVEHANEGVLFLDEIHRLNPEGQEKLFRLIDYGTYSRLGETDREHTARVLIIGATTEETPSTMLSTFLRRIPVFIDLPPLNARSLEERLQLIFLYFWKESQNIRAGIELDLEILNALSFYNCPANIGQLAADIKISCSNAYFEHLGGAGGNVVIKAHHLGQKIIEGLFVPIHTPSTLITRIVKTQDKPIVIAGTRQFDKVCTDFLRL